MTANRRIRSYIAPDGATEWELETAGARQLALASGAARIEEFTL